MKTCLIVSAALSFTVTGCHRGGKPPLAPPAPVLSGKLIPAKPHKPFVGPIELGVFAREAAEVLHVDKLSIGIFKDDKLYDQYRIAVRDIYGADLPDMNYFSIGHENWQRRIPDLRHWLLRAGAYGAPTLALEPDAVGDAYGALKDSPELQKLRDMFLDIQKHHITVWVRFASEANLYGSNYSVSKHDDGQNLSRFQASVKWWKGYMPGNVKLVFSPLINTPYEAKMGGNEHALEILKAMYVPGVFDRIGGTLYSTKYNVFDMYDWYTGFMRGLDANTPLQICELGGPLSHQDEIVDFIKAAAKGRWKGLERINLFAGQVNARAQAAYGRFGSVIPGTSESYIRKVFFPES